VSLTPRPAQEQAIQAILADKRHLCRAQVGAGKTLVGVEAVKRSGAQRVITVAPLNTKSGWQRTFAGQGVELPFQQIKTTSEKDKALVALMDGQPGIFFCGWEVFRRYAMWGAFPIDFAIFDEVHRAQNRKSSTHEAMKSVKAEYQLALSATPWGNHIQGSWAILKSLWPNEYPAFWTFVTKYLSKEPDRYSKFRVGAEKVPGAVWQSIPSKSDFPSPFTGEPIVHTIEVDLTPAQQKIYDRLEAEGAAWLGENLLATGLPSEKYLRLIETTLAVPSIKQDWIRRKDKDTGEWYKEWGDVVYFKDDAKSSKLDALIEVLNDLYAEAPVPVLVFTHSQKLATILTLQLQGKGYNARRFVGGMSPEERQWKLEAFGKEFDILVATIPTMAEGVDGLQRVCNVEVWLSVSDNPLLNTQAKGRLSRPEQTKPVQRYLILARNTVETNRQLPRIQRNQEELAASFTERQAA
jgi:superfamily II DNA or RNA helicase